MFYMNSATGKFLSRLQLKIHLLRKPFLMIGMSASLNNFNRNSGLERLKRDIYDIHCFRHGSATITVHMLTTK